MLYILSLSILMHSILMFQKYELSRAVTTRSGYSIFLSRH